MHLCRAITAFESIAAHYSRNMAIILFSDSVTVALEQMSINKQSDTEKINSNIAKAMKEPEKQHYKQNN